MAKRTLLTFIAATLMIVGLACFGGYEAPEAIASPQPPPTVVVVAPAPAPVPAPTTSAVVIISGSRIEISDASGSVGQVQSVHITVFDARTGISGYTIAVSVADPTVGQITNVSLPPFGLKLVGDLPAASVDINAVDLQHMLEGNIKEERLATVDIELLKTVTSELLVEILSVDDDEGNIIESRVVSGTLAVN